MIKLTHFFWAAALITNLPAQIPLAPVKEADPTWPRLDVTPVVGWPQLPSGWTFEEVAGVAVDSHGRVFIFHRGPHPIMEFDAGGKLMRSWGDGAYVRPHSLRFDPQGNLWAVDVDAHIVVRFDPEGRVTMVLGRKNISGETPKLFNRPTDTAFAPNGDIYVSDGYVNSRVVRFDREGRYISTWGHKGVKEGEFNLPHAIVVDRNGLVYVADRSNSRIQIFDADGKFVTQWTHLGAPYGMALTAAGELYICDGYANRILKVNLKGEVLGAYGVPGHMPGQMSGVHQIAVGPDGSIYVADLLNWRVQNFRKFIPR